jgi:hypothetical protein
MDQDRVVRVGELFKLPTWSKGPASKLEKLFKLRFVELRQDGPEHVRLVYYKSKKAHTAGSAPLGSIDVLAARFERVNKLDFVLQGDKKRLWCRAFSEAIANDWEDALIRVGAGQHASKQL